MDDVRSILISSRKFLDWKPRGIVLRKAVPDSGKPIKPVIEIHYSPAQLAKAWGVSVETVRCVFREEPGVLKIGRGATKNKRGYFTLRIPESIAERVHRRMAA